jgi:ABC-type lipoprotein export system ATPase subunit
MTEILVETREASRTYRIGASPLVALSSVTCRITSSSHIALVGPSGSGKSTLLHLMGGLDTPTAGTVSWPGLGKREALRPEKIAFVFQTPSLLDSLTVVENVEMPLLLGRRNAKDARRAAMEALDRIELADIAGKLPEELSGGQTQRVAVARALAYRPRLILADEPTGQLDHPTASRLFDVLLASLENTDTALVIATHDMTVAERMHDHWRMEHGVLEVHG